MGITSLMIVRYYVTKPVGGINLGMLVNQSKTT